MSALVQLINHQLFGPFLSLELNSHIPETNSHFTPQHLISAPGDLTMSNLAYTASVLEWQVQLSLVKVKVKVNFTIEQATKAQNGSRGIDLLFP